MNNTQSERDVRISKVHKMKKLWITPFANKFDKKDQIEDIIKNYENRNFRDIEDIIKHPEIQVMLAGRIMLHRMHWKIGFAKILDSTEEIQIMFHKDNCKITNQNQEPVFELKDENQEMSAYKFFEKMVDVWDFLWVKWEVFRTHKWELTIFVPEFTFLSKAIRPLPEKFHGLQNQESIYRQRYLDLTVNPDSYKRFLLRSKFMQVLRNFYYENWFIEVETSILWNSASWAAANPFITHHNDFDLDMYLRISPETALKMLTAGRFEKVFEVAKDFRNEWSDPSHHQEFTVIEHYATYRNYQNNMDFTEKMFDFVFDKIPEFNKIINIADKDWNIREVNFQTPRDRIDYVEQVKKDSWIDVSIYEEDDEWKLRQDILEKWLHREWIHEQGLTTMIDYLYKKVTRPKIVWPAFIYNYPKTMQPLARGNDQDNKIVEQWQLLVNGRELIKAYSELVDPLEQQANFDKQAEALAKWDNEATSGDDDFVLAMEHWMPCQSGRWMGIDRIFSILTTQNNLRDVILFPLMKPINSWNKKLSTEKDVCYGNIPELSKAEKTAEKYLKETLQHCRQVAKIMKYFANKLWENEDLRYIAWLLHDVDRDHIWKIADLHLWDEFDKIMNELWASEELKNDIKAHAHFLTGVQPQTLLAKYLVSVDELSGLIYAYSLMRPEWLEWMKRSSLNKKIKDKSFASGVDREEVKNCEKFLNIPLEEFSSEIISAIKN